jgi:hypothetical protein
MEREKVVHWIGVLLAKAADPSSTAGEQEACSAKAEDLMRKYKIERSETVRTKQKDHIVDVVMQGCEYGSWQHYLSQHLATLFETMWIFTKDKKFQTLVGTKEDVKSTLELFLQLATEIACLSLRHNHLADTMEKKEAFCLGAATRVGERASEFYVRVCKDLPKDCRDVIISRAGEIFDHLRAKYAQEISSEKGEKFGSEGLDKAFLHGYKAGAGVDIAGGRKLREGDVQE